ncbi:MAG: N-acetyltransferase [Myxococcales bacterium]|nr:N-acetyltransferase [Myxococcales bacterium]
MKTGATGAKPEGQRAPSAPVAPAWAHASAIVDEGAVLGPGTKVWHFCHVMSGAHIGAGCSLGQNVFVAATVHVGDGCKIQNNVSLYDGVTLASDVFVGPSVVFTNVVNPRAFVIRRDEYRPTHVGRGASIGANATIVCGHDIGAYAFVAAGAVVTRNVPAFALVAGVPAVQIGWICRCGLRLAVDDAGPPCCAACGTHYVFDRTRGEMQVCEDVP